MTARGETTLRVARARHVADEWVLVLLAEAVRARVQPAGGGGFAVSVASEQADRAEEVLAAWERENPAGTPPPPPPPPRFDLATGVATAGAMLFIFLATGPRDPTVPWFALGSADASLITSGEWWRAITALCLHADAAHVLANALAGALFLGALCGAMGSGLGLLVCVVAGVLGNVANAFFHGSGHVSVGASTAVFGAVGALGGIGVARRRERGSQGRRRWAPVAAALGLLAMLGTSARADVWAHLFGLLAGAPLGIAVGLLSRRPPRAAIQWLAGAAALGLVLYAWGVALSI